MFIFDVRNLRSNIPYKLGKQVILFGIEKYPETFHPRFNKKFTTDGRLNVINNYFQFNNINYIQTLGTSMGTKIASMNTTQSIAYLEENLW